MATTTRYIGKALKRKEDPRLIQGLGHYVDDLRLPEMHHAVFVRSPHAHARIRSVDISKAQTAPGVVLVITGKDVKGVVGTVPCAAVIPDMKHATRPVLAVDKVRFVGEAVAMIVGTDHYAVRDAADLVEVDYEPLTAVVNPEKAIANGSPLLYEQYKDNVAYRWEIEGGDLKKAFAQADKIVKARIINQRLIPVAMEPRGVLANYPMVDLKVAVVDGTFHEVDSSELAFKMAGIFALKDAVKKANPILLEPIMKVEVTTPDEYQGDLLGDINRRRGKIVAIEAKNNATYLYAEVPLAELFGYATAIRSLSKGRASYSMEPLAFEPVPSSIMATILDSVVKKPART